MDSGDFRVRVSARSNRIDSRWLEVDLISMKNWCERLKPGASAASNRTGFRLQDGGSLE